MKPWHAAALALVVYLMIPPLDKDQHPNFDVPLSSYMQDSAYDTAAQCENAKAQLPKIRLNAAKKQPEMKNFWIGLADSTLGGLCVESNDPRLAK